MADETTLQQLAALGYETGAPSQALARPLLICDVDEVVLHLVDPFEEVLVERGFELKSHSFKLTGNVFHKKTGREATQEEVWEGLTQLFEEQSTRQHLVDGAAEMLNNLSNDIDVIFLTNMPHPFVHHRRDHLHDHGLRFPVITNIGSKVPAMQLISQHRVGPVGFIDDTPTNLQQARDGVPHVHLFHFMANERFRSLVEGIDEAHVSTGDWQVASQSIREVLLENKAGT